PRPKVVATPEDSERASAGEKINEQAPTTNGHAEDVEQATAGAEGILTPKSGASATYGQDAGSGPMVERSPAVSQHDSAPAEKYDFGEDPLVADTPFGNHYVAPPPRSPTTSTGPGVATMEQPSSTKKPSLQIPEDLGPEEVQAAVRLSVRVPQHNTPRELPPPFCPNNASTPSSATSANLPQPVLAQPANIHQSRPSVNSLVFGGMPDSLPPSPAPPSGNGIAFAPPPPPPPPPPPSQQFLGSAPPFFPAGHSDHISDPSASMVYPPPMLAPQSGPVGFRPPLPQFGRAPHLFNPEANFNYPSPQHARMTSQTGQAQLNGDAAARSPSTQTQDGVAASALNNQHVQNGETFPGKINDSDVAIEQRQNGMLRPMSGSRD
ncbi:hypothetical protein LTS18_013676, partial [Coniosporium uncinatum]